MKNKKMNFLSDIQGNKYTSKNPIAHKLLNNFFGTIAYLLSLTDTSKVQTMTECGCGKGQVTQFISKSIQLNQINSFDISESDLAISQVNNVNESINFYKKSIYDISENEKADLIVCCEVLEHLEFPEKALLKMSELKGEYYLFSVPNEPIWRVMNFLRGKYVKDWGNTPDHVNHWSTNAFKKIVSQYFDIIEVRKPLPWTMILAKSKHI